MSTPEKTDHLIERAGRRLGAYSAIADGELANPSVGAHPDSVRISTESVSASERLGNIAADASSIFPNQGKAQHPQASALLTAEAMAKAGLAIGGAKRSRLSEEYQVFSAQVLRRLQDHGAGLSLNGNLLMVTSAKAAEGKSFTSINLATALARTRKQKVLLIDGDPKKDSLSVLLSVADKKGLFDLAAPEAKVLPLLLPTFVPDLHILPIGTIVAAHETTHRIVAALDTLARQLADTLVIIDAPPCLATSDASSLAARCSHIIMVVEAERTQRADLENALDMVADCQNIALVLNKMRTGASNGFGAYGYYGS